MKKNVKKYLAALMVFNMVFTTVNGNLAFLNTNEVFANEKEEEKNTVEDGINIMIDYIKNQQGEITFWQKLALQKTKVDVDLSNNSVKDTIKDNTEKARVLLGLNEDISNYNKENLIETIKTQLDEDIKSNKITVNTVRQAIVLEEFNKKFPDKILNYDKDTFIKSVIKKQSEDGSFFFAPIHTSYVITLLSYNKNIEGSEEAINKAVEFLKSNEKDDGVIYKFKYDPSQQVDMVINLLESSINVTDENWNKNNNTLVEGLFKNWDGEKFTDLKEDELKDFYGKVLYSLQLLKDSSLENYKLNNIKFKNIKPKEIAVEKLSLENTTLDLEEGTEKQLQLTITPEDAANKDVTWKSSDEKVATIDETGKIKAIKAGDTTITVTSEENEKINCQCKVTVKSKAKEQNIDAVIDELIDECCEVIAKTPCPSNYLDVIGLSRLAISFNKLGKEVPEQWKNGIKKAVEKAERNYEGLVIPTLAIGEDPTNVRGNGNLIEKIYNGKLPSLYNWADVLLALNSGNFNIPGDAEWNKEKLINKILEKERKDGGWIMGRTFKVQLNTYVIPSLAPYYNTDKKIKNTIDKTLERMSSMQNDDGTIKNSKISKENISEIVSQTIIVLCELGIDPTKDERFIKNGHTLIDGLLTFRTENKTGIKDGYDDKEGHLQSTEVALRALTAYKNLKAGKGSIYKFDFTEKEKTVDGVTLDKTYLKLEPKLRENVYLSESFNGKLTATVTPPGAKNKNVKWSSSDENIAKVDQNGNVEAVSKGKATITVTTEENNKTATCEVEVTPWDYDGHIKDNCIPKIQQRFIFFDGISDWSSLALNKSDKQWYLTNAKGKNKTTIERLTEEVKENENKASDTDNERRTLAILACGGDPTNVDGVNLIKKIYNSQDMSAINSQVFAVLALDAGQFNIPKNANWNQEKLIRRILASQANGGWMYGGTDKSPADPDMTAMTLSALAPYYKTNKFEDKDLNEAINKSVDDALKALQDLQVDNGGFKSWNVENCESSAMVIIALCDLGIDPLKDERFIKNGKSPLDALLTHIIPEGNGFDHISNEYSNKMSSEQGFNALTAYINFKENKGSIYKFDFKEKDPEFKVENLTKTEEIKLGQPAKITMKATNNGKEEKETTLIVGVYDNNNKLVDSYVAPKNTVKVNSTTNLEGTVKIPTSGQYKVKAFIWDNLEEMNSLWEDIEFNVK